MNGGSSTYSNSGSMSPSVFLSRSPEATCCTGSTSLDLLLPFYSLEIGLVGEIGGSSTGGLIAYRDFSANLSYVLGGFSKQLNSSGWKFKFSTK